jgi:hypothetical protein
MFPVFLVPVALFVVIAAAVGLYLRLTEDR